MAVFAMPGYEMVFKVMRDVFGPPKLITRDAVKNKYRLVFRHDRAGRLIEAHEFEHLEFDRDRFSKPVLDELLTECARAVRADEGTVVLNHVYVERQVVPLNVYIREVQQEAALAAILDHGEAIRDLAVSNIFPGDMLLKNFGVTRHGRVVFYDYDELSELLDCTFKHLPEPVHPEDEMAAEPWFGVGEGDVFPEELPRFLGLASPLRERFTAVPRRSVRAAVDGKASNNGFAPVRSSRSSLTPPSADSPADRRSRQATASGANSAVKCLSQGGCETIRYPRSSSALAATAMITSAT